MSMKATPRDLIRQRLSRQFRVALLLVIGAIVLVLVTNFFVLLVAYVECWAFVKATIYYRVPRPGHVCTFDGRFHWS